MRKPRIVGDRVLVRIKTDVVDKKIRFNEAVGKFEEISDAGFVIKQYSKQEAENLQLSTQEAYVVQVGDDAFIGLGRGKDRAKVGDLVSMVRWSGEVLPDIGDNHTYRIISDEDILVVWEGEELNG